MAWHTWLIYLMAAVGLSLTPGPNSLLALTNGALHGHRRTLWTVAGGALGFVAVIALSMLGIGALLQASASALLVLKWVGGAYLVWLGIQLWRAPPLQLQPSADTPFARRSQLFRQGLFAAVSNPKALLFYGAFLPQFLDPARSLWPAAPAERLRALRLTGLARQLKHRRQRAQRQVQQHEQADQQQQRQIDRQIDPVRRPEDGDGALVVARKQRQRDRRREQADQPQGSAHRCGLAAPCRVG